MQFIDLKSQQARLQPAINTAIEKVLQHGQYVMGPEVLELETLLAKFANVKFALGCANGTDALTLSLMAIGVKVGDAVFCPSFTFSATAESIAILGATPVFVDVNPDTYNICPHSLDRTINKISMDKKLKARAIISVDLFGQIANYPEIKAIAQKHNLKLISDAAQSFGGTLDDFHPSHWADIMTTSFFPAKPLGCYGDGGAIFTNDIDLRNKLDSLRIHGKGAHKYDNIHIGLNSRLDTLQAAILIEKMKIFSQEIIDRNNIATRYIEQLTTNQIKPPTILPEAISTWAQFTIQVNQPDQLAQNLAQSNIPTARYYPLPTHLQTAYLDFPRDPKGLKNTEALMKTVISLPMHAYLDTQTQDKIIALVKKSCGHENQ